jgi:flavorubredoxin
MSDSFKYSSLVLASVMIDDDISPAMKEFIEIIVSFEFQNRKVGFIESGSWSRRGNSIMKSMLKDCKNLSFYKNEVSIDISLDENSISQINNLANEISKN